MQHNCVKSDHHAIAMTACVLDASHLRIFELAYQDWHGQPPQQHESERAFVEYMLDGKVPCWVRAFTRNTLDLCEKAGMVMPAAQSGHNLTLSVSPAHMLFAMIGLGAACLLWLSRLV